MSSPSCLKRFLDRHCYAIDFLNASLVITICLVVLLPKVHESFVPDPSGQAGPTAAPNHELHPHANAMQQPPDDHQHGHHHHHHNHNFPTGEFLICVGFFVFYCVGLTVGETDTCHPRRPQRVSTVCCSSTRCPSSQPTAASQLLPGQDQPSETDKMLQRTESDCLLLLNRHHNHHTHSRHHEHKAKAGGSPPSGPAPTANNYGSTNQRDVMVVVDEIRITTTYENGSEEDQASAGHMRWPRSVKLLLVSLVLASFLIFFDMKVLGLIKSIPVFRATSTGALLYVAFFLMFPRRPVGCNSCEVEESM